MEYILFCAGRDAAIVVRNLEREGNTVKYFVDNHKNNCDFELGEKNYPIYFPVKLLEENKDELHILVASVENYVTVARQLEEMGFMEGKHFSGCLEWIQAQWGEIGILHPAYELRVYQMAQMISKESCSVLDLGCGRMSLKKYLCGDIKYIPCDYTKHDEMTIVCDLNRDVFPNVDIDTLFMSGVLEYIVDIESLVKESCRHTKREIICSFVTLECERDIVVRMRNGWVNHLTITQFIDLFQKRGMKLEYSKRMQILNQVVMKFTKNV